MNVRQDPPQAVSTALETLELLADERIVRILDALRGNPMQPKDLEALLYEYPHSTLIERLQTLDRTGMVRREELGGMPNGVRYEITTAGLEFLTLSSYVDIWAARPSEGVWPESDISDILPPGHDRRNRMAALAVGWNSTTLQELAPEPIRRTELCRLVHGLSHHQVERRLAVIEDAGLAERVGPRTGVGKHRLTQLGRESMAIVLLAAFWEYRNRWPKLVTPGPAALVEALPVLVPLLVFPDSMKGQCSMTFEAEPRAAAIHVTVVKNRVVSCLDSLVGAPPFWCRGTMEAWEAAFSEGLVGEITYGDGRDFIAPIIDQVYEQIFVWLEIGK